jgi:hypothetical protein
MFTLDPMNHMKRLKQAIEKHGAEASIDSSSFNLVIKRGSESWVLYPQFSRMSEGRRSYTTEFKDDVTNFNGWYPSVNKSWALSSDKLLFKARVSERGFNTPLHTQDRNARPHDVIIKQSSSSFGEGLRGPYREVRDDRPETLLREGEYYEQFMFGWIAKIWFWDETPICMKLLDMPAIVGDGKSTVRELLNARREFIRVHYPDNWLQMQDWSFLDEFLAYQQVDYQDVPARGRQVLIDYRYNNLWVKMAWDHDNALANAESSELKEQLETVGSVLWREIPEDIRAGSVFTVDAILDNRDCLWLLEMNSNPQVHPDVYLPMIASLLGGTDKGQVLGGMDDGAAPLRVAATT